LKTVVTPPTENTRVHADGDALSLSSLIQSSLSHRTTAHRATAATHTPTPDRVESRRRHPPDTSILAHGTRAAWTVRSKPPCVHTPDHTTVADMGWRQRVPARSRRGTKSRRLVVHAAGAWPDKIVSARAVRAHAVSNRVHGMRRTSSLSLSNASLKLTQWLVAPQPRRKRQLL